MFTKEESERLELIKQRELLRAEVYELLKKLSKGLNDEIVDRLHSRVVD